MLNSVVPSEGGAPISERAGLWAWRRGQLRYRTTRSESEFHLRKNRPAQSRRKAIRKAARGGAGSPSGLLRVALSERRRGRTTRSPRGWGKTDFPSPADLNIFLMVLRPILISSKGEDGIRYAGKHYQILSRERCTLS